MDEQHDKRYVFIPRVEETLMDAVSSAENMAVHLRELAVKVLLPYPWDLLGCPSDLKVTIEQTQEGWLHVTLPEMLPRRKNSDRARFLVRPLEEAIIALFRDKPRPQYHTCVLVYEHVYDRSSRRRFIDHDNLELKHCQDVLERYFLVNDTSSLCSAFQCSHRGDSARTHIWVLKTGEFLPWLKGHSDCWEGTDSLQELDWKPWPM